MLQSIIDLFKHSETLILVLVCFNVLLTAVKTILEKVSESAPEVPGTWRQKLHAYVGTACEWLAKLIDWLTANRAH